MTITKLPHKPRASRRALRGSTMAELLLAFIIIGILAAIAIPAYLTYVITIQDQATKSVITTVAENSRALAKAGTKEFSYSLVDRAVAGIPQEAYYSGAAGSSFSSQLSPSLSWGEVSLALANGTVPINEDLLSDAPAPKLGLAMVSPSGNCVFSTATVDSAPNVTVVSEPLGDGCRAANAFNANPGNETPGPPASPTLTCVPHDNSVSLSWTTGIDNDLDKFEIFKDNTSLTPLLEEYPGHPRSKIVYDLTNGTSYSFLLVAYDKAGNSSNKLSSSAKCTTSPVDDVSPSTPGALTALGQERQVSLLWESSTDNELAGYYIYRDSNQVASVLAPITTFIDTGNTAQGLSPGVQYSYTVRAYDSSGNLSIPSNTATATPVDSTPPPTPVPTALGGVRNISLSWPQVTPLTEDLKGYRIYSCTSANCLDFSLLANIIAPINDYNNDSLSNGTVYRYRVTSYDKDGNESPQSAITTATTIAIPPIPSVTYLSTPTTITWSFSNSAATEYFEISGIRTETTPVSVPSITATNLSSGSNYSINVKACSAAGCSPSTTSSAWTTPTAPTLTASSSRVREVPLSWTNPSGAVSGFRIYRSQVSSSAGSTLLKTLGTTFNHTDTALANATTYYYWVAAFNAGGEGPRSQVAQATTKSLPVATSANLQCPTSWDDNFYYERECQVTAEATDATSRSGNLLGPEGYNYPFVTSGISPVIPYANDTEFVSQFGGYWRDSGHMTLNTSACNEAGCVESTSSAIGVPRPYPFDMQLVGCYLGYCKWQFGAGSLSQYYGVQVITWGDSLSDIYCDDTPGAHCDSGIYANWYNNGTRTTVTGGLLGFSIHPGCLNTTIRSGCTRNVTIRQGYAFIRASGQNPSGPFYFITGTGWCQHVLGNPDPFLPDELCTWSPWAYNF